MSVTGSMEDEIYEAGFRVGENHGRTQAAAEISRLRAALIEACEIEGDRIAELRRLAEGEKP